MRTGSAPNPSPAKGQELTIFTIVGGTTVPDRAAIVKAHCREGSSVELRRETKAAEGETGIGVWLQCSSLLGLLPIWKRIGYVPVETALALESLGAKSTTVVAHGTVKGVYAPIGRDEAVVSVEITAHRNDDP